MKKRILSILLSMSIIVSIFTASAVTSAAAGKPATPAVSITNGGSSQGLYVSWNRVANGAVYQVAYRPIGAKSYSYYSTNGTTVILKNVKSGVGYQVQVRARVNGIYGNYSRTKSMTFLLPPVLKCGLDGNGQFASITWSAVKGANKYQLVKWDDTCKRWGCLYTGSDRQFLDDMMRGGKTYKFQVRAMYETKNNGTAYSAWSRVCSYEYYPRILFTGKRTESSVPAIFRSMTGGKRYSYTVNWKARNEKSGQRYEVRFKKNINDNPTKTVKVSQRGLTFESDLYFGYVSVRYLNSPGGCGFGEDRWVALK